VNSEFRGIAGDIVVTVRDDDAVNARIVLGDAGKTRELSVLPARSTSFFRH